MAQNQGIFNRGETIGRAQQGYDLYDFIANRPNSHRQRVPGEIRGEQLDRLLPSQASPDASRTAGRQAVKMLIKALAAFPMLAIYIGPRKIAEVLKPLLQRVQHLIPHLLKAFQAQLAKAEPYLHQAQLTFQKAVAKMKTTLQSLFAPFNQAGAFIARQLGKIALPKFELQINLPKLSFEGPQKWLGGLLGQLAGDVRSELQDFTRFLNKVWTPLANFVSNITLPKLTLPTLDLSGFRERVEAAFEPWKKRGEKVKQTVQELTEQARQIPEMIAPKIQMMAMPMINLMTAANQFVAHQKERVELNLTRWLKQMQERYQRFSSTVGGIALRLQEKIVDWIRGQSWILALLRKWIEKWAELLARALNHLQKLISRFNPREWILCAKEALHQTRLVAAHAFSYLPGLLYRFIEWAFGYAGVLVIKGIQIAARAAARAFRSLASLIREVIVELANS